MKTFQKLIVVVLVSFTGTALFAQNEIHKKNGDVLFVKVLEIGLDEIKYESPEDPGVIVSIDKSEVLKLVMANGREEAVRTGIDNAAFYEGQKKRIIKLNFLSPITNSYFEVLYEKSVVPGKSYELGLGIIGLGRSDSDRYYFEYDRDYAGVVIQSYLDGASSKGLFIRGGYKFLNTPDFTNRGMKYSHILKGFYAKPSLIFGSYIITEVQEENLLVISKKNTNITYGAFTIELGKQWIFEDAISINVYAGLGYGSTSKRDYSASQFGIAIANANDIGLAGNAGVNVGFLLK